MINVFFIILCACASSIIILSILVYFTALALCNISALNCSFGLSSTLSWGFFPPINLQYALIHPDIGSFMGARKGSNNVPLNWTLVSFKHTRELSGFENIAFFFFFLSLGPIWSESWMFGLWLSFLADGAGQRQCSNLRFPSMPGQHHSEAFDSGMTLV